MPRTTKLGFMSKRKPRFETHEFTAPACWASYWINSDASGLEDSDIAEADAAFESIQARTGHNSPHPCDCSESEFMNRPDYGMAGDCCTYSFLVEVKP